MEKEETRVLETNTFLKGQHQNKMLHCQPRTQ